MDSSASSQHRRRPLRLWPGVVIVVAQLCLFFGLPQFAPDAEVAGMPLAIVGILGGVAGGLLIAVWWLFFSRAPWVERVGALVLSAVALMLMPLVVHESIAGAHMGVSVYMWPVPGICLALVLWAVATRRLNDGSRRAALVLAIALACLPWTLMRTAGVKGAGSEYHWRWTPTPEERLLARAKDEPLAPPPPAAAMPAPAAAREAPAEVAPEAAAKLPTASAPTTGTARDAEAGDAPADWPGFRGRARDGVVAGVRISTDWNQSPPVELWRRPVGPGWSSFAVRGDFIYTQEQRGDRESVSCYRLSTGAPVWRHHDSVRFWESNGGAGPRATPAVAGTRVFAFGATGILNALDARTGRLLWSRNVRSDTGRRLPDWGFTSSPLVADGRVIVAAAGTLAAYDLASGRPQWQGPSYGGSYSSPHRATIDGVEQIVLLGGPGVVSVALADGSLLWEHDWSPGAIVQPAVTPDGDIIVNTIVSTGGMGTRRLHVQRLEGEWRVEERWTSIGLKPYFNDFVLHEGHAYGFDGSILASIGLGDGARKWKGGRYGNGQLLLLADQDLLLVISEEGELALVSATPDRYREIAKTPALNGKTWNHPVLVGDVLLLRNGQEMAAFRLPRAGSE